MNYSYHIISLIRKMYTLRIIYRFYHKSPKKSETKWAPLKCLFLNANGSIAKLIISIRSGFFLFKAYLVVKIRSIMTRIANTKNSQQYESKFSLIVEQMPTVAWSTKLVREVKLKCPNFKQNVRQCFELLIVLFRIDRSI